MGNEYSSPRRDDDYDDSTAMSGVSGWSYQTDRVKKSASRSRKEGGSLNFIDAICGKMVFDDDDYDKRRKKSSSRDRGGSDDYSDDDTYDSSAPPRKSSSSGGKLKLKQSRSDNDSLYSTSYDDDSKKDSSRDRSRSGANPSDSKDTDDKNYGRKNSRSIDENIANPKVDNQPTVSFDSPVAPNNATSPPALGKPLASAFAKRCHFTKSGIGPLTQHYEGVTLSGNSVLMLASAMKLKGCPTICDEDLRRVEQTYPNQFSRLPDELLLSSGWRRISKHCHFSGKPIADGVSFFHSKDRLHSQTGGYYFLLANSLGMETPGQAEPLTIDMLILLQTDYPTQCDQAPALLLEDPSQWTLVSKFCFFSGGPINAEEDVYYEADFDGTSIYMLAFLSPNLTPEELYRLNDITGENALKSVAAVEEVDEVYNLTQRDFDDLKLYHLGPCRALPSYILSPESWTKVLPQSFIECREKALARAYEFEAHAQEAVAAAGKLIGNGSLSIGNNRSKPAPQSLDTSQSDEYVEFPKGQDDAYNIKLHESPRKADKSPPQRKDDEEDDFEPSTFEGQPESLDDVHDVPTGVDENSPAIVESPTSYEEGEEEGFDTKPSPSRQLQRTQNGSSPNRLGDVFPDPELSISVDAVSDDDGEFPKNTGDINPMTPQDDEHSALDAFNNEMVRSADKERLDESMSSLVSNQDTSFQHHESDKTTEYEDRLSDAGASPKPTRSTPTRSQIKTPLRSLSPPIRKPKKTPSRSPQTSTPKRSPYKSPQYQQSKHVQVETCPCDEIMDAPDPSPKMDEIVEPSEAAPLQESKISSPQHSVGSTYAKSSAMRGAQQLLKKNRQQRLAIMAKRRQNSTGSISISNDSNIENKEPVPAITMKTTTIGPALAASSTPKTIYSRSRSRAVIKATSQSPTRTRATPKSPSRLKKDASVKMAMYKSQSAKSGASQVKPAFPSYASSRKVTDDAEMLSDCGGSSVASSQWTDTSSRDTSRRAYILKMAKNRMKSKKEVVQTSN